MTRTEQPPREKSMIRAQVQTALSSAVPAIGKSLHVFALLHIWVAYGAEPLVKVDDWSKMKPIQPKTYLCVLAGSPIQIDGRLDDPAWHNASWTSDFVDIEGASRPQPRFRTRAKMLWDSEFFYIGAELEEPQVWATLTQHDSVIFHDNDFEVFIDPNGDHHNYGELEINALNTTWDLLLKIPYKDGGHGMNTWELHGLKTAVHVDGTLNDPSDTDRGWSVELALPWKALAELASTGSPPRPGDQWRVNFSRVQWPVQIQNGRYQKPPGAKEDNWVWSPQGIIDMHRPEQWGIVQFSENSSARLTRDPIFSARKVLLGIYYAQQSYHQKHHRWAATLAELGIKNPKVKLVQTQKGYQAGLVFPGKQGTLWIQHDSLLWQEKL